MGPRDLRSVKVVKKGDYLYARVPGHPNATSTGYVLQHRFVKEQELGRFLGSDEVVHHEDGNRKNNDPINLKVKSALQHIRDHRPKKRVFLSCRECGTRIERTPSQLPRRRGRKHAFCSRTCRAKFYGGRGRGGKKVHGTNNAYTNYGCRCPLCKEAHRLDVARWRKKYKSPLRNR